jgi:hypothetical protein
MSIPHGANAPPQHGTRVPPLYGVRAQVAEHLTKNGFPIKPSYLDHLEWQGIGPPVSHYWGNRPIYDLAECLEWARRSGPGFLHRAISGVSA